MSISKGLIKLPNWEGSTRKETLPKEWPALRLAVFARDGNRCVIIKANGRRCWDKATDCDHIGDREDHSMENLRSLCAWHHQRRSSSQGRRGRSKAEEPWRKLLRREPEKHPGSINPNEAKPLPRRGF